MHPGEAGYYRQPLPWTAVTSCMAKFHPTWGYLPLDSLHTSKCADDPLIIPQLYICGQECELKITPMVAAMGVCRTHARGWLPTPAHT
jgi:hypothetical protein